LKNRYLKNISSLLGSNLISQIILFLSLPAITLLYGPEEFGRFGVVSSIVSIVAILSLLKSDAYIVALENSSKFVIDALLKSILISTLMLAISFLFIILVNEYILIDDYSVISLSWIEYLVILFLVFFYNIFQLVSSLFVNQGEIFKLAKVNVARSFILVLFQFLLGVFKVLLGLWFAELMSRIGQSIMMIPTLLKIVKKKSGRVVRLSWGGYFSNLKPYSLFSMPSSLISTLSQYLPVFFTASLIGFKAAGLYFMASRLITIPASMLAHSVSKAFIAEYIYLERQKRFDLIKKTILSLFLISSFIVTLFYYLAPLLESFEPQGWGGIVSITATLAFIVIPTLTVSSISQLFNLLGVQKLLLLSEAIKLCILLGALFAFKYSYFNKDDFYTILVISTSTGYFIQLVLLAPSIYRLKNK
jgi:O-antigen/teichoic acid export membrane protein